MMNNQEMHPETPNLTFRQYLYNHRDGTVLGRTYFSWFAIFVFYTVFYACLASMVIFCAWIFLQTLDPRMPKWILGKSLIGENPGMGFRPMPHDVDSSMITFRNGNNESIGIWVDKLRMFLDGYYVPNRYHDDVTFVSCDHFNPPRNNEICQVDVRVWRNCNLNNLFNYHRNEPCIFLKLNKIYGWDPIYYQSSDLPDDMPQDLKHHINTSEPHELDTIWVSCDGEDPSDRESIGPIRYYPRGFPGYYYPFLSQKGYLSPLVAVQLTRPTVGVIINIECKAWAKNIQHSRYNRMGSVHFEILIN